MLMMFMVIVSHRASPVPQGSEVQRAHRVREGRTVTKADLDLLD